MIHNGKFLIDSNVFIEAKTLHITSIIAKYFGIFFSLYHEWSDL